MAGDPYTDVTVLNYNSNPPADDGSQVPSNEITWAKGKEKIGDPLKTAIESVNTNVGGAVDKLSGGITSVAADYTVLAGDQGKTIVVTAASKTVTTPAAGTVASPFRFYVSNTSSGDCTLDGNAAETIDGALTVTIPSGRGVMVETDGSNWKTGGQNWPEKVVTPIALFAPTGRLTLTTATPVLTADTLAQTTVYYSPYVGGAIMLYDGTNWKAYSYAELSQTLADNTKSPAATTASNIYDMFVWVDGTTMRCTRGPSWSTGGGSAVARGTGAGSTELVRVNGVLMNANAISNGPVAQRGVYVGTIATDGSNQLNMKMNPAAAAGGGNCRLDVWNMYNRVPVSAVSKDSTDSWNYSTATWRAANNNNSNRITAVFGLNEEAVIAQYAAQAQSSTTGTSASAGVGLDSTSAFSGYPGAVQLFGSYTSMLGTFIGLAGQGSRFFQALEYSTANPTTTWLGDNGAPTVNQMALTFQGRM